MKIYNFNIYIRKKYCGNERKNIAEMKEKRMKRYIFITTE